MISIQHLSKSYGATAPAKRGKRPAGGGADLSYAASVSGNPALVVAAATQATAQAAHGAAEAAGRTVGLSGRRRSGPSHSVLRASKIMELPAQMNFV